MDSYSCNNARSLPGIVVRRHETSTVPIVSLPRQSQATWWERPLEISATLPKT